MRTIYLGTFALSMVAAAAASAACPPNRTIVKTGPNGKTLTLCLDGKYSTCVKDSQRLGWSDQEAKRFCERKREQGRIR